MMPTVRPSLSRAPVRLSAALLGLALVLAGCRGNEAPSEGPHDHAAPVVPTAETDARPLYTCGMHPQIVQEGPGYCPICGMELTPLRQTAAGEGVVAVDPVTLQNIGVRTAAVAVAPLARQVRTTGRFEASQQVQTAVAPKIGGWVERLYVDYEGARVRRGEPLLDLYSPELVSTQEEYLLALRNLERLSGTAAEDDARRLLEAARRRLAYWDIADAQIEALRETGTPQKTLTLYAPTSGTVTRKSVVEGQQIAAGQTLLEVADLSRLWLMVDVYEQDLAWVDVGTVARIALPYDPARTLEGRVDYVYDTLDPATRTAKARVPLPNPGGALKPGMYATATLVGRPTEPAPVVPEEALVRTGEEAVVLLALGAGRFRPVTVTPGLQAGGQIQIVEGLQGGEQVVTSAQFLIDSEARLKSAVGAMTSGHDHGARAAFAPEEGDQGPARAGTDAGVRAMRVDVYAADQDGDGVVSQCPSQPHLLQDREGPLPGCTEAPERVPVGVAQAVLHDLGYTNVPVDPARADVDGDGIVYQSPMHWAVLADAPGTCDICHMNLQRHTVEEARQNLIQAGYTVR